MGGFGELAAAGYPGMNDGMHFDSSMRCGLGKREPKHSYLEDELRFKQYKTASDSEVLTR